MSQSEFIRRCARLGWRVNIRSNDGQYMEMEIVAKDWTLLTGAGTGILDSDEDFNDWVQQVKWDNNV